MPEKTGLRLLMPKNLSGPMPLSWPMLISKKRSGKPTKTMEIILANKYAAPPCWMHDDVSRVQLAESMLHMDNEKKIQPVTWNFFGLNL